MRHLDAIHITRLIPISHPSRLILFQGLLACWMVLITLAGPTILAQTGPQPGATEPMGNPSRYFLLRDDNLLSRASRRLTAMPRIFYDYRTARCDLDYLTGCTSDIRVTWTPI